MTECVMNNQACFLAQDPWQDVFRSVVREDEFLISDRSEITISLIMIKAFMPGLFRDVTNIICIDSAEPTPQPKYVEAVIESLRRLRASLRKWRCKYTKIIQTIPDMSPGTQAFDAHCKVFSTYVTCLMISSRLLGTLSPFERADCEDCTQRLSLEIFELTLQTQSDSEQTTLFMALTAGISASVRATQPAWQKFTESESDIYTTSGAEMARSVFESWCNMMGRKIS
jgi:hypothetical protein